MQLYTIKYQDIEDRTKVEWLGTQADVAKRKKALKTDGFVPQDAPINVPTDKAGLLAFLNAHANDESASEA